MVENECSFSEIVLRKLSKAHPALKMYVINYVTTSIAIKG